MKKILFYTIVSLITISGKSQDLFDDSFVHEIRVNSSDANLWQTLTNDYDINYPDVPYQETTVSIDGNVIPQTGVRLKGFSSYFFSPTNKKSIKLHFEKFVNDQEYQGVRKLNLANGVGDPTLVKDKLAYDIFRMHGIPAPRVAHARVYINDVFWGVYAMIEQVDKRYLKRNFADKGGNLWKNQGNSDLAYLGTNPANYPFELQTNETENDWSKFIEFVDVLNNSTNAEFADAISEIFDMDEYLRIFAVDVMLNNWDSYLEHGRNWYLYHDPVTNKIHWQPWDYNFSFDRESNSAGDMVLNYAQKILNDRILATPEFRETYYGYMCELVHVNMTPERFNDLLDNHLSQVQEDWNLASNNFFTVQQLDDSINGSVWNGNGMPWGPKQGLKLFITNRRTTLMQELAAANFTCNAPVESVAEGDIVINEFMADNGDDSMWPDQDGDFDDWIELYNNTSSDISLKDYFLSDDSYFDHKWEFPEDAVITANGYYIVWADKDLDQDGIHAKFSLDKDGEKVILSYLDGSVIDSVDFGEQTENLSFARLPNGTGDFVITDQVTFNSENGTPLGVQDMTVSNFVAYPNPANSVLNLDTTAEMGEITAVIYDMMGRKIVQKKFRDKVALDVSSLQTGIYTAVLSNATLTESKKIIIE